MHDRHRGHPDQTDTSGILPVGFRLAGRYRIVKHLAAGGFGITYLAEHEALKKHYAIKEHFPREFAFRDGASVRPNTADKKIFEWALKRFAEEAEKLAKFKHPAIVNVADVFEDNGTAYMVMEFEQGQTMSKWLDGLGRPPSQAELDCIVGPLLDALEKMHGESFLHRDIAPDNIIVRPDGSPCLIDFGAARQAMGQTTKTLTAIVKAGYSPIEQYVTDASGQGPWTDIYAFAATLYRAATGAKPPEAPGRTGKDNCQPARSKAADIYRAGFLAAIDKGLNIHARERPQSVSTWREMLNRTGAAAPGTRLISPTIIKNDNEDLLAITPAKLASRSRISVTPEIDTDFPSDFVDFRRKVRRVLMVAVAAGLGTLLLHSIWLEGEKQKRSSGSSLLLNTNRVLSPDEERSLEPKDEFQECDVCPRMVVVPGGKFQMGSTPAEKGHRDNEAPVHEVAIARPFAVGKFTVTFAEWEACVVDSGCQSNKSPNDQGWGRNKNPVVNVSWHDAKEYLSWLNRKTGKGYRLLSEAEWEYSARAHTMTVYWWGNDVGVNLANCYGCGSQWDFKQTAPVGSFSANPFGLHDTNGNVWQWVDDCWHENYNGAPLDGSSWRTGDCGRRVLRGGTFVNGPEDLRSAHRTWSSVGDRGLHFGFRVGRALTP